MRVQILKELITDEYANLTLRARSASGDATIAYNYKTNALAIHGLYKSIDNVDKNMKYYDDVMKLCADSPDFEMGIKSFSIFNEAYYYYKSDEMRAMILEGMKRITNNRRMSKERIGYTRIMNCSLLVGSDWSSTTKFNPDTSFPATIRAVENVIDRVDFSSTCTEDKTIVIDIDGVLTVVHENEMGEDKEVDLQATGDVYSNHGWQRAD